MASASSSATTTTARAPRSAAAPKLTCLCSPTSHPGSFRCSRHRNSPRGRSATSGEAGQQLLHEITGRDGHGGRASAKGRSVRALLLQKVTSPSGRDRRGDFRPRPSRLRLMDK